MSEAAEGPHSSPNQKVRRRSTPRRPVWRCTRAMFLRHRTPHRVDKERGKSPRAADPRESERAGRLGDRERSNKTVSPVDGALGKGRYRSSSAKIVREGSREVSTLYVPLIFDVERVSVTKSTGEGGA